MPKQALVTVEQLSIKLGGQTIIPNLSFDVHHNEILGIVGESGSGKSITAMSLMGNPLFRLTKSVFEHCVEKKSEWCFKIR
jgi:ABC-type glutathione transport system ATPase component